MTPHPMQIINYGEKFAPFYREAVPYLPVKVCAKKYDPENDVPDAALVIQVVHLYELCGTFIEEITQIGDSERRFLMKPRYKHIKTE